MVCGIIRLLGRIQYPKNFLVKYWFHFLLNLLYQGLVKLLEPKMYFGIREKFKSLKIGIDKNVLLNFEAVDWETTVWINDKKVGTHKGGYDPFTFDISSFVEAGKSYELLVSVWDPTSEGYQPRGKQVNDPRGIWYTSTTGIWQTVWLESVPECYIEDLKIETDIDKASVVIKKKVIKPHHGDLLEFEILEDGKSIAKTQSSVLELPELKIPYPKLWSPENPFLYDLKVRIIRNGKIIDEVESYFGMRKISLQKDENGYNHLALNNSILFQNGPLDQGFWPDGLYTPPTDEAMRYDIEITKQMGFNMLRKHVKVENRRFYYWCDKLGILVWQDMPNAAGYVPPGGEDLNPAQEHKDQFEYELTQLIRTHQNHPSIVMWVPFNEGWGQYETERIVDFVYSIDSTRLVNNASGWQDRGVGDVIDIHHYPEPRFPEAEEKRASVLGEFGGLGLYIEGHTWQKENWGYEKMNQVEDLLFKYEDFYQEIIEMRDKRGLAAVVYTQTTDVETETNGLMTYDREIIKMGIENINNAHLGKIPPRLKSPFREFINNYVVEFNLSNSGKIYYTLDGSDPDQKSISYTEPFTIEESSTIKARTFWPDETKSRIVEYTIYRVSPIAAVQEDVESGLKTRYYEGNWDKLPDFENETIVKEFISRQVDIKNVTVNEYFGLEFEGFIEVPETDTYSITLSSDDGAIFYLHGNELINYDGIHGARERMASLALEKGLHPFKLVYFQRTGGLGLKLSWESQKFEKQEINQKYLKHKK